MIINAKKEGKNGGTATVVIVELQHVRILLKRVQN